MGSGKQHVVDKLGILPKVHAKKDLQAGSRFCYCRH